MKNANAFGAVLTLIFLIIIVASASVNAELATLDETTIEYVPYREVVLGQAGVVYQIRIMNTGEKNRSYELTPDTSIIKEIGSYRIDPSARLSIKSGGEETAYFFLSTEAHIGSRKSIPLEIRSGLSATTINLVARPIGPFQEKKSSELFETIMKIAFYTLLVILIIIFIIRLFSRRNREKPAEEDDQIKKDSSEIETYY